MTQWYVQDELKDLDLSAKLNKNCNIHIIICRRC